MILNIGRNDARKSNLTKLMLSKRASAKRDLKYAVHSNHNAKNKVVQYNDQNSVATSKDRAGRCEN